ncbi:MAG TPA: glycosyltransferase family A protein [Bacteroidales bacterium]
MKMNPEISVVIPTYNRSAILQRAINSIVSQTFKDWELIVVDDCSTDNTFDIVKLFTEDDKRIKYHKLERNSGANAARNLGIKFANADIISFLDSDDEMHPLNLQKQYEKFLSIPDLALCYTGVDYYSENKMVSDVHPHVRGSLELFLFTNLKGLGSSTSGFSIRKEVFEKIGGFDESMVSQQDLDLLVRVARFYTIDFIEGCNTKMYLNSGNRISDNRLSVIQGEVQFMQKHEQRIRELGLYHHVARKLARKYALYAKDLRKAYSTLFKAIRYRPTYFYAYIYALKLPVLYFKR